MPLLDPLTQLPRDPKHLAEHASRAQALLGSSRDPCPLPDTLQLCLSALKDLSPAQVAEHRRSRLAELKTLAASTAPETETLLQEAPAHARAVLRAASPTGVHVALIKAYLSLIQFPNSE